MKRDLTERLEGWITRSAAVRGAAKAFSRPLNGLFQQTPLRPAKLLLNGSWLEHPLHPLLTDVPVGAWTVAIVLDLVALVFRVPNLGLASGLTIGFGTLVALATIASGVMDWLDVDPPEMAIGAVHALINTVATVLFAAAFVWRWRTGWVITGDKFALTLIAYLTIAAGAFLGGSLVLSIGHDDQPQRLPAWPQGLRLGHRVRSSAGRCAPARRLAGLANPACPARRGDPCAGRYVFPLRGSPRGGEDHRGHGPVPLALLPLQACRWKRPRRPGDQPAACLRGQGRGRSSAGALALGGERMQAAPMEAWLPDKGRPFRPPMGGCADASSGLW